MAQTFYMIRLYRVSGRKFYLPAVVVALSLAELGFGMYLAQIAFTDRNMLNYTSKEQFVSHFPNPRSGFGMYSLPLVIS